MISEKPSDCQNQGRPAGSQDGSDGWNCLDRLVGDTVDTELELTIQRQVQLALTRDYLPSSTFTVKTIPNGNTVEIYVYLNSQLIATQTVSL